MSVTDVNLSELHREIVRIESNIEKLRVEMGNINRIVEELVSNAWVGIDSLEFEHKWNNIKSTQSTYGKMLGKLEYHLRYLKGVENTYRDSQREAIRIAGRVYY